MTVTTPPMHPSEAAWLLREIGAEIASRCEHRLPGITDAYERRTVLYVNSTQPDGILGGFTPGAWNLDGHRFDKLTIQAGNIEHQAICPEDYARNIVCTLVHEIAHAYTYMIGVPGTIRPGHARHTEHFARIATRLGLEVTYQPEHPSLIVTPNLSVQGRAEFLDLTYRLAAANISRMRGRGYATPEGFMALIDAASSSSSPTTQERHDDGNQ